MKTQKEIEEMFDERFGFGLYTRYATQENESKLDYIDSQEDVKSFISQIRQSDREAMVEMVKDFEIQKDRCDLFEKGECVICSTKDGKQQVLTDILSELNKE